jgi:hypothetical protein
MSSDKIASFDNVYNDVTGLILLFGVGYIVVYGLELCSYLVYILTWQTKDVWGISLKILIDLIFTMFWDVLSWPILNCLQIWHIITCFASPWYVAPTPLLWPLMTCQDLTWPDGIYLVLPSSFITYHDLPWYDTTSHGPSTIMTYHPICNYVSYLGMDREPYITKGIHICQ